MRTSTGSAPGGENLRCTDWRNQMGTGQLCTGGRLLLLENQGLRKPKCESSEVAKGLKKAAGRHSMLGAWKPATAVSPLPLSLS